MSKPSIISRKRFEIFQFEHMRLSYKLHGQNVCVGRNVEDFFFYELRESDFYCDKGPIMLTVAKLERDGYFLMPPEYLTKELKLMVFQSFIKQTNPIKLICVDSIEDSDIIRKEIPESHDIEIITAFF